MKRGVVRTQRPPPPPPLATRLGALIIVILDTFMVFSFPNTKYGRNYLYLRIQNIDQER